MKGLEAAAIVAFYAGIALWITLALIRTKAELSSLLETKEARKRERASRGIHDVNNDILCLLTEEEKKSLIRTATPLPKWLGGKQIEDLSEVEASYFAGRARSESRWKRYQSQAALTVGAVVIGGRLFDTATALFSGAPLLDLAKAGIPLCLGLILLMIGVRLKESSDELESDTKALEDRAHNAHPKPTGRSEG